MEHSLLNSSDTVQDVAWHAHHLGNSTGCHHSPRSPILPSPHSSSTKPMLQFCAKLCNFCTKCNRVVVTSSSTDTPRWQQQHGQCDAASWCVLQHLHRLQHSWRSLGLKRVLSPDLIPLIAFLKLLMPILGKPGQVHGRLLGWSQIKSRNVFTSSCVGATRTSGATKTTSTSTKRAVTSLMSIISVCGERERLTHPFSFFTQNPPKCPNRNEWTESLAPVPLMLRRGMRTGRLAAPNTPSCVPLETASVWRQHRGGLWMGGRSPGQEVSLLSCSTV